MDRPICRITGCENSSHWRDWGKRGLCGKHYRRWHKHGNPLICKYADDGSGCIDRGYKIITINGKQKFEHRHLMEKFLGRELNPKEIIHHINGNTLDNRIENLQIGSQNWHAALHAKERFKYLDKPCDHCGKIIRVGSCRRKEMKHHYCSSRCAHLEKRRGGKSHIAKYH